MKKTPIGVQIPCVLDWLLSVPIILIFILGIITFIGEDTSFGFGFGYLELAIFVWAVANAIAAFYYRKGNSLARYISISLKILVSLLLQNILLVIPVICWAEFLIRRRSAKEYFS